MGRVTAQGNGIPMAKYVSELARRTIWRDYARPMQANEDNL
jgi:hypothetical protein